jgi:hypothetical protein
MVASFLASVMFVILTRNGVHIGYPQQLVIGIFITTVCWVATAYLGPQNDPKVLMDFYMRVRPFGPGWRPIQVKAGISNADATAMDLRTENFPLSLLGWFTGCIMIWSALFTVGNFLYGRMNYAFGLLAVFVVTGTILIQVVRRLWR